MSVRSGERENYLSRAVRYRSEGAKCRAMAKQTGLVNIRREYGKLADIYDRLARDAEQMHTVITRRKTKGQA